MIGIPMNPNSVHVPMVQTGCLKFEFDSTYPIHLNGIISQGEYQESIARINRTISSNKALALLGAVFAVTMVAGVALFVAGGVTAAKSFQYGFPVLIGVGIALTMLGSIFFSVGCCVVQFRRLEKIRRAVADESSKYSARSATPCSWRLDSTTTYAGYYGNQPRRQVTYHLVIDIGHSSDPGSVMYQRNQVAPDPTTVYGGQSNFAPPPYFAQSAGFCPQCRAPRAELSSRFCSSCGQSFNKY